MKRILICVALMAGAIWPGVVAAQSAPAPNACVSSRRAPCPSAEEILAMANAAARQGPRSGAFVAARQIYAYETGGLYQLQANPSFVSTIFLEPGEAINAIAAGDTTRWMVTEAESESDVEPRAIVLVKPQGAGLRTNVVIVTDRRTYVVEALSRSGENYTAQLAWTYPGPAMSGPGVLGALNFNYRVRTVRGRTPAWSPVRVFDDGAKTWIEFGASVAAADLPPLFVLTGEGAELVNYRVQGQRYVVDRIFDRAELRLGVRTQTIVRVERTGPASGGAP